MGGEFMALPIRHTAGLHVGEFRQAAECSVQILGMTQSLGDSDRV